MPAATAAVIRADGGMSASDWTMQCVADMIDAPVDRPVVLETTALGAGYLAGWQSGLYPEPDEFARNVAARATLHAHHGAEQRDAQARGLARCRGPDGAAAAGVKSVE